MVVEPEMCPLLVPVECLIALSDTTYVIDAVVGALRDDPAVMCSYTYIYIQRYTHPVSVVRVSSLCCCPWSLGWIICPRAQLRGLFTAGSSPSHSSSYGLAWALRGVMSSSESPSMMETKVCIYELK